MQTGTIRDVKHVVILMQENRRSIITSGPCEAVWFASDGTKEIRPYHLDSTVTSALLLEAAGVTWHIYQDPNDNGSALMHGGLAFQNFRQATAASGNTLYENGMTKRTIGDLKQNVSKGPERRPRSAAGFARRFPGRMETGRQGVSNPVTVGD